MIDGVCRTCRYSYRDSGTSSLGGNWSGIFCEVNGKDVTRYCNTPKKVNDLCPLMKGADDVQV